MAIHHNKKINAERVKVDAINRLRSLRNTLNSRSQRAYNLPRFASIIIVSTTLLSIIFSTKPPSQCCPWLHVSCYNTSYEDKKSIPNH